MTTLQMQGLGLPATDDPMETDADRRGGQAEEIDIDLDLTGEQQQVEEDEYMSEDVATFHEHGADNLQVQNQYNDDEMADDGYPIDNGVDAASIQDEDLQDAEFNLPAGDEDRIVETVDDPTSGITQDLDNPQYQGSIGDEMLGQGQEVLGIQEIQAGKEEVADPLEHEELVDHENHNPSQRDQQSPINQEFEQITDQNHASGSAQIDVQDSAVESSTALQDDGQRHRANPEPVASDLTAQILSQHSNHVNGPIHPNHPQPEIANDAPAAMRASKDGIEEDGIPFAALEAKSLDLDGPTNQEDGQERATNHLHSVIIVYQDSEYALFPPIPETQDLPEYLLANEELASESITNLLMACRSVLAGDLSEQDELAIRIVPLDLSISESASDASTTTLSELVDLYLLMQQCDGVEDPLPLYINLYTAVSFSHRLNYLRNALREGKGLSQVKPGDLESLGPYGVPDQEHRDQGEVSLTEPSAQEEMQSQAEDHEEDKERAGVAELGDVTLASTFEEQLAQSSATFDVDFQAQHETVAGNVELNRMARRAEGAVNHEAHETVAKNDQQVSLNVDEAEGARFFPSKSTQLQEEQEPVPANDGEDIIDYEDDEEPAPRSSAGSSTLQGDVIEATAGQILPLPDELAAPRAEVLPETEASSNTIEDPATNDSTSHQPPIDHSKENLFDYDDAPGDEKGKDFPSDDDIYNEDENLEENGVRNEDQSYDQLRRSADAERTTGYDDVEYTEVNDNDEEHGFYDLSHGTVYEPDEGHTLESKATDNSKTYLGPYSEDLEQSTTYDDNLRYGDPREGNKPAREDIGHTEDKGQYDRGTKLFADDPPTIATDNSTYQKNETIINLVASSVLQSSQEVVDQVEDNDEITYEDEEEEVELTQVEHGPSSPGSLKRMRSHPDGDDPAIDGLQDAKRIRPT